MVVRLIENTRLLFMLGGAVIAFLGERYFSDSAGHLWFGGIGLLSMVWGLLAASLCLFNAKKKGYVREATTWWWSVCWQGQLLASFLVYYLYQSRLIGGIQSETLMAKSVLALWLLLGVFSLFMGIGTEWSQINNGRGEYAEPQRVRLAAMSWLKIGILAVVIAAFNYTAAKRNVPWDLSYLKTSEPSQSTIQLLEGLAQNVDVALFFPSGNEVLSKVRLYFENIKNRSPKLSIRHFDVETNPLAAEEYKASRNGFIVLRSGDQSERFDLGLTLESARKTLKNMDGEFQQALVGVTQKKKVLYFTRGHGELSWVTDEKDSDGLKTIKKLEGYLRSSAYVVKFFGLSDGAGTQVPADADAVVVIGGDLPFTQQEARVIKDYVESGGKLLALLDVDVPTDVVLSPGVRDASRDPLVKWLKDSGAEYRASVLANLTNHVKGTSTAVDVWFLFTNVFTSHASVQSLARNEQRAAMIALKSGYFLTRDDLSAWQVFDTVRSLSDSFVDENRNFRFEENTEKREPRVMGVAMEQKRPVSAGRPAGKIAAFADATFVSDALISNPANLVYFVDSLRWLFGEASVVGVASSEEDVPIRHTSKEDVAWFYGTIALVPSLVLLAGRFATGRARKSRRLGGKDKAGAASAGGDL